MMKVQLSKWWVSALIAIGFLFVFFLVALFSLALLRYLEIRIVLTVAFSATVIGFTVY